jgi:hypothetical protein
VTIFCAVPADGWTDNARRFALSSMGDLDESEPDDYLPAFFGFGESVQLEVRGVSHAKSRLIDACLPTQDSRRAALAEPPPARNLDEAVSLDIKVGGVAVLHVGTFVAYRKAIKPEDLDNRYFEVQTPPAQLLEPLEPAITGRLIVLCGPVNASGSTRILAGL